MPKTTATKEKKSKLTIAQKLQAIAQCRRTGDNATIAAKTGYDPSHVSRVLRGQRNNESIVNVAYASMSKRKVKTV